MFFKRLFALFAALLAASSANAATFIVTTTGDTGGGMATEVEPGIFTVNTLRSAVQLANNETAFPGPDQIVFADDPFEQGPTTIELNLVGDRYEFFGDSSNSALGINSDITIAGPRSASLTLSAGNLRHLQVNNGRLTLSRLTLTDGITPLNLAGEGGAIVVIGNGSLAVSDTLFEGNRARNGGAIHFGKASSNPASTITNVVFANNTADQGSTSSGSGGAIEFDEGAVVIRQSSFDSNFASSSGGAVFVTTNDPVVIESSTFTANSGSSGGAISANNSGVLTLHNSTVSNNTARFDGGGIELRTEPGEGTNAIVNTTITGNVADTSSEISRARFRGDEIDFPSSGGGLIVDAADTLVLHNTLITDNHEFTDTGELVPDDIAAAPLVESSNNLFSVADSLLQFSDGVNGNQIGTQAAPIDALLLPLADNGGPTLTHQLSADSPAIDAGNDARANEQGPRTDQRLFERFVGTVDIGAVEFGATDISDVLFADSFETN